MFRPRVQFLDPEIIPQILDEAFALPAPKKIDRKLLSGAALFGTGWGISGLCPGPALANIFSGNPSVLLFVGAMVIGFLVHEIYAGHVVLKFSPARVRE